MTIIQALKSDKENIRLSNGNKWLCWDPFYKTWVVYFHKYRAKYTRALIRTTSEKKAVDVLLEDFLK